MQKATNEDDLQNITYADVQALELNSLDTQEGMSGVYRNRWEIAKGLSAGEVYGPYEDNGKICVMKCIEKEADGQIAYENVKDQIVRYLQDFPVPFDLHITITDASFAATARNLFSRAFLPLVREVRVLTVPNRGRDVAPWVLGMRPYQAGYDLFCHIHSKESAHIGFFLCHQMASL